MKKADLLIAFGTLAGIGAAIPKQYGGPLSRSAVQQWEEDIPELRAYQLREAYPDLDRRIEETKIMLRKIKRVKHD